MTDAAIFISEAVHKAVIDVDENGTTAAAASCWENHAAGGVAPMPVEITLDKPFLFFIHSDQTQPSHHSEKGQTVIFAGRVVDPIQHESHSEEKTRRSAIEQEYRNRRNNRRFWR